MKGTRRFRIGLALAITALFAALIATTVWQLARTGASSADSALRSPPAVATLLFERERDDMQARASALAGRSAFVSYVSQALAAGSEPGARIDVTSISDLLQERAVAEGFKSAAVLDVQGQLVAASTGAARFPRGPGGDALIAAARDATAVQSGPVVVDGHLAIVAVAPITQGETIDGLLYVSRPLSVAFATTVASTSHADVALLLWLDSKWQVGASTLGAVLDQRVSDELAGPLERLRAANDAGFASDVMRIAVDNGFAYARVTPLLDRPELGAVVSVLPASRSAELMQALVVPIFVLMLALLAGIAIAIVLLNIYWVKPVLSLAEAAAAAVRGDHALDANVRGTGRIAQIAMSFNLLQTRLREARRGGPAGRPSAATGEFR